MDRRSPSREHNRQDRDRLLVPGVNCWRIEKANRLAVIVDAADYFAALKSSIRKAQRTVFLVGWDFDTRIRLQPGSAKSDVPDRLGRFLSWIVDKRPDLEVFVLKWDLGVLQTTGRGSTPIRILDWITSDRMHFRLDGAHPPASAHHQKVVVIDDALAFCGGIDITAERWDTRAHRDGEPRRRRPTTRRRYGPWHDATTAVDGDVARALGELARARWKRATGDELPAVSPIGDPWPDDVRPSFENIEVAIARTLPEHEDREEMREIEALYLSAIGAAKRSLYVESQYFASRRIAEAIAARLRESDPPEIVIVNPESAGGWLEEKAMGGARARLLKMVADADRSHRFRMYNPVTEGGRPIYVHAKIMVVDDWLLRVGSSNLNNRSLGYDTECDLAVEAGPGATGAETRRRIVAIRDDLLAEHLGASPEALAEALDAGSGSLIAAIEALRFEGRGLRPFQPPDIGTFGEALAENDFLDPESADPRFGRAARWRAAVWRWLPVTGRSRSPA